MGKILILLELQKHEMAASREERISSLQLLTKFKLIIFLLPYSNFCMLVESLCHCSIVNKGCQIELI